jgi:Fe-S cluster assembly protein SufD
MFIESIKRNFEKSQGTGILQQLRQKSWDQFLKQIPREFKSFDHVPLKKLYQYAFNDSDAHMPDLKEVLSYVYPECKKSYLVFVNGAFMPRLSNTEGFEKNIVVLPMSQAVRSYMSIVHGCFNGALKEKRDPFIFLNLALCSDGLFFYVPPKVVLKSPVQIVHINMDKDRLSCGYGQCFLGPMAKVELISTTVGDGVSNLFLDFSLEDDAMVRHYDTSLPGEGWNFKYLHGVLKKGALLQALIVVKDRRVTYQNLTVVLDGERGEALLQGLWDLQESGQAHIRVEVFHKAMATRSLQKFKGVLDGSSLSSFAGEIVVEQSAQKTEAYQRNNNLLLSSRAIAYTSPNLKIFADDVKASHGATVAQLDPEQIFYLKSRGIGEIESKKLLTKGFMEEILSQIGISSIKEQYV